MKVEQGATSRSQTVATADDTQPDRPSLFGWSLPREGVYWLGAVGMLTLAGWLKSINLVLLLAYFLFGLWLLNVLIVGTAFRRVRGRRHWAGPVWAGRTAVCEVVLGNA